ncbi:MAG: adenine-specific methyltransferase EcoRI family protein [Coriobacteriia bacterium]|nr:adenine-specific methyltransferase EcoRI family protein [Coriobacteriia bacterium]
MANNSSALSKARVARADEFYTQLVDIENELRHYREQLRGKTILCNCDDPYESNFFKYFAMNFNFLGLKKLIATSFVPSPIAGVQLPLFEIEGLKATIDKEPFKIEIHGVHDLTGDGSIGLNDIAELLKQDENVATQLHGDNLYCAGDFRSSECVELLREADIVVTNPPFSLFREFIVLLAMLHKQFLIIGNMNAITYKEVFRLIMTNNLWLGESIHSGDREFRVPKYYPLDATSCRVDEFGNSYIRVKGVRWFTNLDVPSRHEKLPLYKTYSAEEYPTYDNYAAINVNKTAEIPADYYGIMGVPISFMDKYNPDQFEIIGASDNGAIDEKYKLPHFKKHNEPYIDDKKLYKRIFIQRKDRP